jgi:hypothetical protein
MTIIGIIYINQQHYLKNKQKWPIKQASPAAFGESDGRIKKRRY